MADTVEDAKAEVQKLFLDFRDMMSPIIQQLKLMVGDVMKQAADEGKKAFKEFSEESAQDMLNKFVKASGDVGGVLGENIFGGKFDEAIRSAAESLRTMFGSTGDSVRFDFGKLESGFAEVASEAKRDFSDLHITDFIMSAIPQLEKTFQPAVDTVSNLQKAVMGLEAPIVEVFGKFSTGSTMAEDSFNNLQDQLNGYRRAIVDAATSTGLSVAQTAEAFQTLAKSGVDPRELLNATWLTANSKEATQAVNSLQQAMLFAKGAGLEMSTVGSLLSQSMTTMGLGTEDAVKKLGVFAAAQAGSRLAIEDVAKDVMSGAGALKFYGENVDSAAAIYQNFVKSLGAGKEGLAGDLFKGVIQGISQMSDGWRAFIGMTGQVGGGTGGAIGGALRVEQAIETGNLEGIMGDLKETLTRFSGSPIMGRDAAIASGQEQQYFVQRQLLGSSLGINDPGQANKVLEMLSKGEQVGVADIRAQGGRAFESETGEGGRGQININRETTVAQQAMNESLAIGIDATGRMSDSIDRLADASSRFIRTTGLDVSSWAQSVKSTADLPDLAKRAGAASNDEIMQANSRSRPIGAAQLAGEGLLGGLDEKFGSAAGLANEKLLGGLDSMFGGATLQMNQQLQSGIRDTIKELKMNQYEIKTSDPMQGASSPENAGQSASKSKSAIQGQGEILLNIKFTQEGTSIKPVVDINPQQIRAIYQNQVEDETDGPYSRAR